MISMLDSNLIHFHPSFDELLFHHYIHLIITITSWKSLLTTRLIHTMNHFIKTPLIHIIIYVYFTTIFGSHHYFNSPLFQFALHLNLIYISYPDLIHIIVSIHNIFKLYHISFRNIFMPFWFFKHSIYSNKIHVLLTHNLSFRLLVWLIA
jgi:hypothetical protein